MGRVGAASTDHARDHAMLSIPIGSCTDTSVQIFSSVNSVHTWMHMHTKSTQGGECVAFSPRFLPAHKERIYTYIEIDMHGHTCVV